MRILIILAFEYHLLLLREEMFDRIGRVLGNWMFVWYLKHEMPSFDNHYTKYIFSWDSVRVYISRNKSYTNISSTLKKFKYYSSACFFFHHSTSLAVFS